MATVNPIGECQPNKPSRILFSFGVQSSWVLGESSRGTVLRSSEALAIVVLENFADYEQHTPLDTVDIPSIKVGENHHNDEARVIKSKKPSFIVGRG